MKKQKSKYSYDKKQKLAKILRKITDKQTLVNVFFIIKEENKDMDLMQNMNNNGMWLFFDRFSDSTYEKIEAELKKRLKSKKKTKSKNTYVPYTEDDFPSQTGMSPKLKFSNKEKNLIKRKRYDKHIKSEDITEFSSDSSK